ncbi:DMT family transporter [Maribrevibacterium harenarium]|uniref:DMT family transporter n=1 Tax=Maribrevibacterium harenarium TaxID=2589817 RepID=A0A501X188_9GAMM|nr:DMT family transporter [Maribrevibacterium harenarium]TPE53336.1 DMT family transporter [Maribrevibacterium harenarium]
MALVRLVMLVIVSLVAFAANSVLTRLALADGLMDAASFTMIRLLSGSIALLLILSLQNGVKAIRPAGSWLASSMLFIYAVVFSYAYLMLATGTGALILFGMVQLTMVSVSLLRGEHLRLPQVAGILLALLGLAYLVWPEVSQPSWLGVVLMVVAGMAWAGYTLLGRGSNKPLADTAFNFLRTTPMVLVLFMVTLTTTAATFTGTLLAILSGAVASGAGYAIWYSVLRHISSLQAGVLQLLVPAIAAFGGVLFVTEPISLRLLLASGLILGGIFIVLARKR